MKVSRAPTDEELFAALERQELVALEVLYDRHHRLALGLARRMLDDYQAAEDVVQEVFLAVWQHSALYRRERGSVKNWILAMTHHRAVDRLRRRPAAPEVKELGAEMEDRRAASVWEQAFAQIRGEQVSAALNTLPPEQRETIELAYFRGKSQSEIATLHGVPLGTVKGRTRLALEKLRVQLLGLREDSD